MTSDEFAVDQTDWVGYDPETDPSVEASRVDRLRADGWTECGTCGGYGYALPEEPDRGWSGRCTNCAHGLVPPDGMVEAAARWAHTEMGRRSGVGLTWEAAYPEEQADYMRIARSMLVAAARWEAPGE